MKYPIPLKCKSTIRCLLLLLALWGGGGRPLEVHGQLIALKTDGLMDVALVPNVGVEFCTSSRTSVALNGWYSNWQVFGTLPGMMYGAQPEFRYWLSGKTFYSWYIGLNATLMVYDMTIGDNVFKGDVYAGGLMAGYAFHLKSHLALDCHVSLSGAYYTHDRSWVGDNLPDPQVYAENGVKLIPQVGASLIWIIR